MVSTSQHSPVALVTGSGKKRVGWHVADALAQRGYNLAIHYRSSAEEAAEAVDRSLQRLAVVLELGAARDDSGNVGRLEP